MKNYIYLLFSVTIVFLSACANETGVVKCPDGTFCPDGYRCEEKIGEEDSYQCTNAGCGNRIVELNLNEECDLGDANSNQPNAVCRANCQFRDCGDNILDDIEECDEGSQNTYITGDATAFEVVDGQVSIIGEADYQNAAPNSCRAITNPDFNPESPASQPRHLCRVAGCWDGIVDDGEECDDANDNQDDTCVSCVQATCGDGIENQSDTTSDSSPIMEECDNGIENANEADKCRLNCTLPTCGDDITDTDEECDQGENNANEPNYCRENCELPYCGDNIVDSSDSGSWDPEDCDEGADNVDGIENACRADCTVPQCGDGLVDSANPYDDNEQCDDNNYDPNDGCDANCQKESGWSCTNELNQPSTCLNSCGDGIIVTGETCDDKNINPDDGCTPSCDVEPGWDCSATGPDGSICVPVCGDSRMVGSETCDDGNTAPGDGCNSSCLAEVGYICTEASPDPYVDPSVCQPDCGDGLVRGAEVCDDSNNSNPNDGCADDCRSIRHGWVCDNSEPSNCHTECGDNLIAQIEGCDNGVDPNTGTPVGGDGCSASCAVETGWNCIGEPSVCNTVCGDGILIVGHEACDPPEFGGETCIDHGFATEGTLLCENNCQTISDASCSSICGNGQVEPGEDCDDSNSDPDDGCASCSISTGWYCSGEPSNCMTNCGDSIQAGAEICDNTDLNGRDCTYYGYSAPAGLGCNASCTSYVTIGCSNSCGDGNKESGEQCDDGDNSNGDGCDSFCNVEDGWDCPGDPSVCTEICGDTLVVGSEACDSGNLNGRTCTYYNYSNPSGLQCNGTCDDFINTNCTNTCPDAHVEPDEQCDDGNFSANDGCDASCQIESGWICPGDPSVCTEVCGDGDIVGTEVCDGGNLDSKSCTDFNFTDPAGLACLGDCTNFDLSGCNNDCGDGSIEPNEACDDGDSSSNDGCSDICTIETGWNCTGEPSSCEGICGDTLVRGSESCDDGDTSIGDGCDNNCQVEPGWICDGSEPTSCNPDCGDSLIRGTETCDDGNNADLDGCSSSCQVEPGWNCDGSEPTSCTSVCGDGIIVTGEACDDNDITNSDGCSSSCQIETGWNCTGEPSVCDGICGDSLILGTETCDDGNTDALDGCNSSCQE
ncbi:MAG: DUF4215 domain-containing protein, partial [Deltaproteobacteria bacterium]|nr:DUF4215 domain-containing protein [Deltaproteobacteria bacterium]